jgi:ATP-binding cassette subfamily C protein CydD
MSAGADSLAATPAPAPSAAQRLLEFARPARSRLLCARVALLLGGALLVPQAWLISHAMQRIFVDHQPVQVIRDVLIALLVVGILRVAMAAVARFNADAAVERVRLALRGILVPRLLQRGPRWLRQQSSGELAEAATGHVDALEGYVSGYLPVRFEVMVVPLIILAAVFWVDRVVGLILLLTLPLAPVFMMLVGWGAEAASRRQLRSMARLGGHFADRLRALGLIRIYGRGPAELAGIEQAAEGLRQSSLKVLRIAFLSSAVLEFFASISVAMIALYLGLSYLGMIDLRATPLPLSAGVFCLLLAPEFYAPLRRLATHYHDRAAALAAAGELGRWLDEDAGPMPMHAHDPAPGLQPPGVILRAVTLRPAPLAEPVIRGLDLQLPPGEHLALIGASGSGKTTLLEALAGWLPAESGSIAFDSPPRMGYAPQRPYLFQGSLADNLRLAAPEASDAEVLAAAEAAQVMRFARHWPAGLDTQVGERGFGLSGGEARRVALARLFLRKPNLLLLDEPTAFLDPATEQAVIDALLDFARGRSMILATHSAAVRARFTRVLDLGGRSADGARS